MKWKLYFWVLFGTSAVLFFSPIQLDEHTGLGLDKLVHAGLFALLLYLAWRGFSKQRTAAFILLLAYGVAVELIQGRYIPHRHFDLFDILADWIGLGILGVYLMRKQKKLEHEDPH